MHRPYADEYIPGMSVKHHGNALEMEWSDRRWALDEEVEVRVLGRRWSWAVG
jgi:hypothetical protein